MLKFIRENHGEKVGLGGIVCILLGAAIFFGATPRGQSANAVGDAWIPAAILIVVGLFLFALSWSWNR